MKVAVWGRTATEAMAAGRAMGIPRRLLVAVGDRAVVRGLVLHTVIVLPSAKLAGGDLERDLRIAQMAATAPQWVDLRGAR